MARANVIEKAHQEFGGITASAAATICGVNPYDSPYTLYQRMVGELPPLEETWEMVLGRWMEPVIMRAFTHHTKLRVRRPKRVFDPNFFFATEDYGFPMGALLDGWTVEDGERVAVEAKHASTFAAEEWSDEPPLMHWFQLQHQLACTGWRKAYICALLGKRFVSLPVERDDELIALITDREREFYWNLQNRVPPEIDGHPATSAAVKRAYAHSEPGFSVVISDPEVDRLCEVYRAQGEALAKLERERDATKSRLLAVVSSAESAVTEHYKVTAKEVVVPEKVVKAYTMRPLKVTELKGDT